MSTKPGRVDRTDLDGKVEQIAEVKRFPSCINPQAKITPAPQNIAAANPNAVDGPDPERPREFLEQFPLDSLRMVGSLEINQLKAGLVQATDGLVHRVTIGNHLGQNYGRVTSISDSEIELVEIIPDGLGGYIQRPASIGLSD